MSAEQIDHVQQLAVAVLVVAMMISLGLKVRATELLALVRRPRALLLGGLANIVVVPALVVATTAALGIEGGAETAMILCAAAPAGPAAALYADTARADLPLAAAMTIALPAVGLVTTPLTVALCLGATGNDAFALVGPMARTLLIFQVLPLGAAMAFRRARPTAADRAAPWASRVANVLLALVAVSLLVLKGHVMFTLSGAVWFGLLAFSAVAALMGFVAALPERASARTGAIVGLSRNVTVALLLAASFFPDPVVDATILTFALLALVGPLGLALWWRRAATSAAPASAPSVPENRG